MHIHFGNKKIILTYIYRFCLSVTAYFFTNIILKSPSNYGVHELWLQSTNRSKIIGNYNNILLRTQRFYIRKIYIIKFAIQLFLIHRFWMHAHFINLRTHTIEETNKFKYRTSKGINKQIKIIWRFWEYHRGNQNL